jgi:hypothetical protein
MAPSKIIRTVAIGFAAVIVAILVSLASAAHQSTSTRHAYNADRTYMGAAGCEKDFGYGRTLEACD